ncbi:MAG: hypothetical protein GX197_09140 [Firmicutes bacterium]|nr:hypothetical protein [Bacillota bacterium]
MKNHLAIKALKFFLFITPFLLGFAGYLPLYNYDCFWASATLVGSAPLIRQPVFSIQILQKVAF